MKRADLLIQQSSSLNGGGHFVDIFTGQIHSENIYQIQYVIYQIDDKDLLDHSKQIN